jgi:hypothetical protein
MVFLFDTKSLFQRDHYGGYAELRMYHYFMTYRPEKTLSIESASPNTHEGLYGLSRICGHCNAHCFFDFGPPIVFQQSEVELAFLRGFPIGAVKHIKMSE